jgi:hypothetical protein
MSETYDDEMMRRFVAEEKKTPQEYLDIWRQRADPHRMVFHGDYAPFFGLAQEWVNDLAALRAQLAAAERRTEALEGLLHDARDSLRYVRSWSKTLPPILDDFWIWREGWDCDLELRLDAALAGSVDAPATGGDDVAAH